MPRVKQVTAAKDYPKFGIVKGQKHYHWKRKTGPYTSQEYRQVEPPRIEQMTSSSYKIAMHYIEKAISEVSGPDDIDGVKEMVEALASEQREKFDNMPEGLQQGDTGQTLEQQADTLDSAVGEFDTIRDEWQEAIDTYDSEKSDYDAAMVGYSEYETALGEWDEESGDPEPEAVDEPDEPEEVDTDDFLSRLSDIQLES